MTADGVLVAMHDKTLTRTADAPEGVPERYCRGLVSKKTLEQIKMCDAGSWFGPEYAGLEEPLRIPTLEEIFERYGTSVNYYIETKNPDAAPGMEEEQVLGENIVDGTAAAQQAAEAYAVCRNGT
jgi:glycerophosphoryl diester phosphodiesterase